MVRTVAAPLSIVVKCGGVVLRMVVCGVVLVVSCVVVLFWLCVVCVTCFSSYTHGALRLLLQLCIAACLLSFGVPPDGIGSRSL